MNPPIHRRSFLGQSLAGLAAASPALNVLAQDAAKPLRIGLVSAASYGPGYGPDPQPRTPGSNHGTAFATIFNGYDEEKAKTFKGTFVKASKQLEGGKVVKIWDPDKASATAIADICGIATSPSSLTTAAARSGSTPKPRCARECPSSATSRSR